jgi:hypothetical protein
VPAEINRVLSEIRREVRLARIHTERALALSSQALTKQFVEIPDFDDATLILVGEGIQVATPGGDATNAVGLASVAPPEISLSAQRIVAEVQVILPDNGVFLDLRSSTWHLG